MAVSVLGYGLIRPVSLWTASERHGKKVTPMERQQPAGPPCLSASASSGQKRKNRLEKKQAICSPGSLPSFLSLSGFYLANEGGCLQTGSL